MTDNNNSNYAPTSKLPPTTSITKNHESAVPSLEQQDLLEPEKVGDFIIGKSD